MAGLRLPRKRGFRHHFQLGGATPMSFGAGMYPGAGAGTLGALGAGPGPGPMPTGVPPPAMGAAPGGMLGAAIGAGGGLPSGAVPPIAGMPPSGVPPIAGMPAMLGGAPAAQQALGPLHPAVQAAAQQAQGSAFGPAANPAAAYLGALQHPAVQAAAAQQALGPLAGQRALGPAANPGNSWAAWQHPAMQAAAAPGLAGLRSALGARTAPATSSVGRAAAMRRFLPMMGGAGMGLGLKRGGKVSEKKAAGGELPTDTKKTAGRARQWGDTDHSAEDLPPKAERKARGGIITKRPKAPKVSIAVGISKKPPLGAKAPVSTPSPYDYEDEGAAPSPAPSPAPGMAKGGKWIQGAIKHPGALHKQLGVPQGEKIPPKKLAAAAEKGGKLGRRARLAQTLTKLHKAKGGECSECEEKAEKKAKGGKIGKFDSTANLKPAKEVKKLAAGGAAKQRKGYPNTAAPPKRLASGGKVRGCGVAERGCGFSGVY